MRRLAPADVLTITSALRLAAREYIKLSETAGVQNVSPRIAEQFRTQAQSAQALAIEFENDQIAI